MYFSRKERIELSKIHPKPGSWATDARRNHWKLAHETNELGGLYESWSNDKGEYELDEIPRHNIAARSRESSSDLDRAANSLPMIPNSRVSR